MKAFMPLPPRSAGEVSGSTLQWIHWLVFALFVAAWALVAAELVVGFRAPGKPGWPEVLLVLFAAATTLVSLSRQLPGQNVLLAAAIIALLAGGVQALGAITAIPFGPYVYTEAAGPRILGTLPWAIPLVWIIAILNARGIARLMLRPWRKTRAYGFWLIGITTALVLLLTLGLEPFATRVMHYWFWSPTRLPIDWHGAPVTNFVGWTVTTLLILAFATPSLINKRAAKNPTDYHPLILWTLLNALFIAGAIIGQLWLTAGATGVATAVTLLFAIRGARW
jgi:uncharacterized membrane protein